MSLVAGMDHAYRTFVPAKQMIGHSLQHCLSFPVALHGFIFLFRFVFAVLIILVLAYTAERKAEEIRKDSKPGKLSPVNKNRYGFVCGSKVN